LRRSSEFHTLALEAAFYENRRSVRKLSASLLTLAALVICSCHKQIQKSATDITDIAEPVTAPGWIKFKSEAKETDELVLTSLQFQQFFKTVEVENAEFRVRARENVAVSANGHLAYDFQPEKIDLQIPEARGICAET
jgi:hypothetical protein